MTLILTLMGCACELPEDGPFPPGSYGGGDGELLTVSREGNGDLQLGCTWWAFEELTIVEGVFETTATTEVDGEVFTEDLTGTMCGEQIDALIDGRQVVLILDQEVIQPPCVPDE